MRFFWAPKRHSVSRESTVMLVQIDYCRMACNLFILPETYIIQRRCANHLCANQHCVWSKYSLILWRAFYILAHLSQQSRTLKRAIKLARSWGTRTGFANVKVFKSIAILDSWPNLSPLPRHPVQKLCDSVCHASCSRPSPLHWAHGVLQSHASSGVLHTVQPYSKSKGSSCDMPESFDDVLLSIKLRNFM